MDEPRLELSEIATGYDRHFGGQRTAQRANSSSARG